MAKSKPKHAQLEQSLLEKNRQLRRDIRDLVHNQRRMIENMLTGTVTKEEMRFSASRGARQTSIAEVTLAGVSRKLVEAQEQERSRIARELHDNINQRLALLSNAIEQVQKELSWLPFEIGNRIRELQNQTTDISTEIHALSHELHSSSLEYLGFLPAVKKLTREFSQRQGMEIEFSNEVIPNSLTAEISLCLFRIIQEALHNVAKHSGGKRAELRIEQTSDELLITISDSGRGFDIRTASQGSGLALASIRERIRLVNGSIVIRSSPEAGTTIQASVPIPNRNLEKSLIN